MNALVGTAISASLLPPVANAGMLVAYAVVGPYTVPLLDHAVTDTTNSALATRGGRLELLYMALLSFALFVMNFAIIVATTFVMFELKHIVPASMKVSFIYRYISRDSCSQFDSLPLTSLTIVKPAGDLFTSAKDARAAVSRVTGAALAAGKDGARRRAATSPSASGASGSYERLAAPLVEERRSLGAFSDGGGGDLASFPAIGGVNGGAAASMVGDIL